jgi:RHS repeat-associated protein
MLNPFLAATRFHDWETGFYYYGYRYYDPSAGRWLCRDPIGERGGRNLYCFVHNNPINLFDYLGWKCAEAKGRHGMSRIVFDPPPPNGGWKIGSVNFTMNDEDDTYDGIGMMSGTKTTWTAKVAVLCRCDNGCYQTRHGTRVFNAKVAYEFFAQQPGAGPVDIPTPTALIELIGEAAAAILDESMEVPVSLSTYDLNNLTAKIKATKPSRPTDGKWKGDKSPCED